MDLLPHVRGAVDDGLPGDLRDALTRRTLEAALDGVLPAIDVVSFERTWWDGQSHAPCLVVRGGPKLLRVVETGGEAVVLPFEQRAAQRSLADIRRPRRVELGIPAQRSSTDIVVDVRDDVLRCAGPSCGVLLPLGYDASCPVCGRQATEEFS